MNCFEDWSNQFMDRAIDNVSGRLHEPITLTEENAWIKTRDYRYDGGNWTPTYIWRNMLSARVIEITKEEFQTQERPNL